MKTITLDDRTYEYWKGEADAAGVTVEQLLAQDAKRIESIRRSQEQFAKGEGRDARTVMREIAAEKGIKLDR